MNIANISIKRPTFVTCIVFLIIALGVLSFKKMPVDLFPDINFPVIMVFTMYPGAGPSEVENLISKKVEEELSSLPGLKKLRSQSMEGMSRVIAEFTLETDIKYAEQQVRDKVSSVRRKIPTDAKDPIIRRMDPSEQAIAILALSAPPAVSSQKLYDIAENVIKPKFEQLANIGLVDIFGGRKREIQVQLDREKMKAFEISAMQVTNRIQAAGQNIPAGKLAEAKQDTMFRTAGEFSSLKDIEKIIVNFIGNDVPVTVAQIGRVYDTLVDETSRVYVNGEKSLFMMIYRQSGSNTVEAVNLVRKQIENVNLILQNQPGKPQIKIVRDGSKVIKNNIDDVKESILIGIVLTFIVVYLFLGNFRSTIITGIAIPNSIIGAFFLMSLAGFTINIMTLLAISLAVGLLIDDAIVVRENIFRHNEMGKNPVEAALIGTKEVTLAVIATTFTLIAVFGPVAFLQGIVGQFFKQFGLSVCFAMFISLFDSMTMAPMLSAYFVGKVHKPGKDNSQSVSGVHTNDDSKPSVLRFFWPTFYFEKLQQFLVIFYEKVLRITLKIPILIILLGIASFIASLAIVKYVPKTFIPPSDMGEFSISMELSPGATLDQTNKVATEVNTIISKNKEVMTSVMVVGGFNGESNKITFYIELIPSKKRKGITTTMVKDQIREQLRPYDWAKTAVKEVDLFAAGRPFQINIVGQSLDQVVDFGNKLFERLKKHSGLKDPEFSYKPGKPEFQIIVDDYKASSYGITNATVGLELRNQVEGNLASVFREGGLEYDVRVRMQESNRNIRNDFNKIYIPNINNRQIQLKNFASKKETTSPASIDRIDRGRSVQIGADIAPNGPGLGGVMNDVKHILEHELKLPEGMRYSFTGQSETFTELGPNMIMAAMLGILFIFLVLASLYESFVTPFTIMLVLPLAACGAFAALYITKTSLDIYSMIGCIMLLGLSTKNSILLVDYANQKVAEGLSRSEAIIFAGKTRLRPILMTTAALIAGMVPIAIGLNEASKQRVSMGIAIIGGLISSTLLTLVVVPAAYSYIDRFRIFCKKFLGRIFGVEITEN
ncbi:MAG: efflux RND transporter permease subunit [Oligoflexia bacterium]|nr:efflux RND transporter permease subunit [Oligoflexia bacterium]